MIGGDSSALSHLLKAGWLVCLFVISMKEYLPITAFEWGSFFISENEFINPKMNNLDDFNNLLNLMNCFYKKIA